MLYMRLSVSIQHTFKREKKHEQKKSYYRRIAGKEIKETKDYHADRL